MLFAAKKNQRGDISPADFNMLMTQAQSSYIDYLLGEFQKYTPGRPVPPVALGATQRIRQSLSPLIPALVTLTVDSGGFAAYPAGHIMTDAMYTSALRAVRFVEQDSLASYLESTIDPVATNPIYLIEDSGFRFYPTTLGTAKISYVKTPTPIVYGYTLDGNGRPVYDAGTSTGPVWQDTDCLNIMARAFSLIGVNLQYGMLAQYSAEIKNVGQ